MGCSFRNVADHSGAQLNTASVDAQPPVTFYNVADNIFVIVVYLLTVRVSLETKGDETAGELLRLETALMTDLGIEFGQLLESVLELDDFHTESRHSPRHSTNVLNVLNDLNDWN